MAYNNEFPHFEADKFNLGWILEQYSTFNRKIQEIKDYFDETVQGVTDHYEQIFTEFSTSINQSFSDFTDNITNSFNSLSNTFDIFRNDINSAISTFETNITNELNSYETTVNGRLASQDQTLANATASFQRQLDAMEADIVAYIGANIDQWQVEAGTISYTISNNTLTCDKTLDQVVSLYTSASPVRCRLNSGIELLPCGNYQMLFYLTGKERVFDANGNVMGYNIYTINPVNMTYTVYFEPVVKKETTTNATLTLAETLPNDCDVIVKKVTQLQVTGGSGRRDYADITNNVTYHAQSGSIELSGLTSGYTNIIEYYFIKR